MSQSRLKDVVRINRRTLPETIDPDYSFKYIDIGSVDQEGNVMLPGEVVTFGSAPSRARRLAPPGSTVVSTVRTYLRTIASVPYSEDRLVFSTGFAVLEAGQATDPRFLYYYCRSEKFISDLVSRSTGVSYPAINPSDIGNLRVSFPSLAEQRRIADFLDAEITNSNRLANCYKVAAETVDEREKALIRDVLSTSASRPVGQGKIPWLPRYPRHWDAVPIRYLARIQRGASPRPIDNPEFFDDEGSHAWVRISDVTASRKHLTGTTQRLSALGRSFSVSLDPGELFVSIAASVGKPMITQIPCCIHDGFVALRRLRVQASFLYYVLLLGDAFQGLGKLGTQLNLNSDTIGSIIVPVPPKHEQDEIVAVLERNGELVDLLRAKFSEQQALLAERKQALITAAVAGQVDVTTARGPAG